MNELRIDLGEEFAPVLGARDTVDYIDQKVGEAVHVILDFKGVEFISRSFAHRLWLYVHNSKKQIELVHMSPSVKKMWELIDRQLTTGKAGPKEKLRIKKVIRLADRI
ncbi:MAG: hypothetical protein SVE93_06025 [Candidatus Thermoplasmatota archaeon]|nr:hypothetical protein [Candidatus Thermoplasmatota archaeon]